MRWLYRDERDVEETRVLPAGESFPEERADAWRESQMPSASPGPQPGPSPYSPAQHTRQPSPATPSRRRRRRPLLRLLVSALALWLLFLIATPIFAYSQIETVEGVASPLPEQPGNAVLLVGSDGRGKLSDEDRRRLGTGSTEGQRTDTVMLLYTAPNGHSAILGFPRDSYVKIPGHGRNKLNAAYSFGGAPLLIRTIEENTGIRIDGYLEVGMLGLVDMVDAVGGIQVCPKRDYKDKDAHLDIRKGCQQVDGVTALAYARMRKSDPRGDLGRMERQREVISQVVQQSMHPLTFINPVRYWGVNMGAAGSLARTQDTGLTNVFGAGVGLLAGWSGKGVDLTVPVADANARTKAGSSVLWDERASKEVFDAIIAGDVAALEKHR